MSKKSNKSLFLKHNDDETIHVNKFLIKPIYNLNNAEKIFKTNIEKFIKKNKNSKLFGDYKNNFLIFIIQDFFWLYCYNVSKYQMIFDQYGSDVNINDQKGIFLVAGYKRILKFINLYKPPLKLYLFEISSKIKLLLFILKCVLKMKRKNVFVSESVANFDEVKKVIFAKKMTDLVFPELKSYNFSKNTNNLNINEILEKNIRFKLKNIFIWKIFLNILKPKKIITLDNLFDDQSLLYLCKKKNIEIIGVSHGSVSPYHKGLFGLETINTYPYKFNKLYVWSKEYANSLKNYGNIYKENEIYICGWLNKTYRKLDNNIKKNKFVLYPYEHVADFNNIKLMISYFLNKNYKLIVKKRPGINNYSYLEKYNPLFVDQFSDDQIKESICFIASATSLIFDFQFTGKAIVIPDNKNFNVYKNVELTNIFLFEENIEKKIMNVSLESKKVPVLDKQFISEINSV